MSLEWTLLGIRILAAIILYTFLGLAFYIIWRDLKNAIAIKESQPEITHQLQVVDATRNEALAVGEILSLQPITLLGRDPDNTIVIKDSSASAKHARLRRQNGVWMLEDLGSRYGTILNELNLAEPTPLTPGDIIGIGKLRLRLETITEK